MKKEIGIVTFFKVNNYGAILQAFATQIVIKSLGHDPQIIDFCSKRVMCLDKRNILVLLKKRLYQFVISLDPQYRKKTKKFERFRKKLILTSQCFSYVEAYKSPPVFDVYLAGSDQIWNSENKPNLLYFLDFVKGEENKKLSYASSFGTSSYSEKYKDTLKMLLEDFDQISVREKDGLQIVKELTGRDAVQSLDPTLLLSKDEWGKYLTEKKTNLGDYILVYALTSTPESVNLLQSIKAKYDLPVVGIPMGYKVPSEFKVDKEYRGAGPIDFISYIRDAKVVVTSSFHGLAFAINFEKTFYTIPHPTRNSRLNSLLEILDMKCRQCFTPKQVGRLIDSELFINYENLRGRIDKFRDESLLYLKKNLEC